MATFGTASTIVSPPRGVSTAAGPAAHSARNDLIAKPRRISGSGFRRQERDFDRPLMDKLSYRRHRFPRIVIQQAVWLYFRFALSYRDVEDMLAERGIDVSYETAVRRWALKFGTIIARKLRRGRPRPDGRWHLDEVFVSHQWQTAVRLACRGQRRRGLRYARDREVRPPNCAGSWRSTAAAPSDRR